MTVVRMLMICVIIQSVDACAAALLCAYSPCFLCFFLVLMDARVDAGTGTGTVLYTVRDRRPVRTVR